MAGVSAYVVVKLRYPAVLVVAEILCCVVAADVVIVKLRSELVSDSSGEYVALDVVLLAVEAEGCPVRSVESW